MSQLSLARRKVISGTWPTSYRGSSVMVATISDTPRCEAPSMLCFRSVNPTGTQMISEENQTTTRLSSLRLCDMIVGIIRRLIIQSYRRPNATGSCFYRDLKSLAQGYIPKRKFERKPEATIHYCEGMLRPEGLALWHWECHKSMKRVVSVFLTVSSWESSKRYRQHNIGHDSCCLA